MQAPATIEVMSTRLFPKQRGADAYALTGIAARCDWVVLSDDVAPHALLVERAGQASPRHVFLSLRSPFAALAYFFEHVLPRIEAPFVLVSGSEDVTVPHQLDRRWRRFDAVESQRIQALLDHPLLLHWFAENLDDRSHPKFSPLPLGMVFAQPGTGPMLEVPAVPPLAARPLRALCAHRVRPGAQWNLRRQVTALCRHHFAELCTIVEDDIPEAQFVQLVREHAFVICVEGGGLDPSPKAWQAIWHGAIPIIRATPLQAAYARLPVAFVRQWDQGALSAARLEQWRAQFAPAHDEPAGRAAVLERLGIGEWWAAIEARSRPPAGKATMSV